MTHFKKHIQFSIIGTVCIFLFSINGYSQHNYDIGITEIISPTQVCEGSQEWLTVKVENFGTQPIDSFMLVWDINGNTDSMWVYDSINVYPNLSYINVNIDTFTVDSGLNVISVKTKIPNNIPDQDSSNDSFTDNVQELYPEIVFLDDCDDGMTIYLFIQKQNTDYVIWDFGDGTTDSTNTDTVIHLYPWTSLDSVHYTVTVKPYNVCNTFIDSVIYVRVVSQWIPGTSCLLSTNNIKSIAKINIYPNPSTDFLNIEVLRINAKPINLQLFNSKGSLVYSQESSGSNTDYNTQIDISEFPRGLYFLRIQNGDGYQTHKVVIN